MLFWLSLEFQFYLVMGHKKFLSYKMTQLFLLQKIGAKFYMGRAEITKNNLQILILQTVQVFNAQPESAVTILGQLLF